MEIGPGLAVNAQVQLTAVSDTLLWRWTTILSHESNYWKLNWKTWVFPMSQVLHSLASIVVGLPSGWRVEACDLRPIGGEDDPPPHWLSLPTHGMA